MKSFREDCIFPYCIALVIVLVFSVVEISAETYQYDPAGRLTSVTYDNGSAIAYSYDNAGNIKRISKPTSSANNDVPNSSDNSPSDTNPTGPSSTTTITTSNSPCFVGSLRF